MRVAQVSSWRETQIKIPTGLSSDHQGTAPISHPAKVSPSPHFLPRASTNTSLTHSKRPLSGGVMILKETGTDQASPGPGASAAAQTPILLSNPLQCPITMLHFLKRNERLAVNIHFQSTVMTVIFL